MSADFDLGSAEALKVEVTKKQEKTIRKLYREAAKEAEAGANKVAQAPSDFLKQKYLKDLQKELEGLEGENADETTGIAIIRRAIEEPLRQICKNAGVEGAVIVNKVREGEGFYGYNAKNNTFCDLRAAGVVDPAKVARVALENAASIAGMFLTTECVICDKKEDKPEMPMAAPGMGGMM